MSCEYKMQDWFALCFMTESCKPKKDTRFFYKSNNKERQLRKQPHKNQECQPKAGMKKELTGKSRNEKRAHKLAK